MKIARTIPPVLAAAFLLFAFIAPFVMPHEMHHVRHRLVPGSPLPYEYFQLLRLVVCGAACYYAFSLKQHPGWLWTMVAVAVLFNPLLPVMLSRGTWQVIDLAAGVVFLASIPTFWKLAK